MDTGFDSKLKAYMKVILFWGSSNETFEYVLKRARGHILFWVLLMKRLNVFLKRYPLEAKTAPKN